MTRQPLWVVLCHLTEKGRREIEEVVEEMEERNREERGKWMKVKNWLIVLGFNNTSTLEGHFVSSPRERKKRDRRDSRRDERERQGRKRNRNEREETEEIKSEETEEIKTFPLYTYLLQGQQTLPNCKPISVGHPSDARCMTPLPHPTTPP